MALTLTNDILKFRESTSDPWEKLLIQANMNFNLIYPVGSIYMSTVNVDPGTIFGGTWERLKDRFLLGAGDSYTAGDTGGEATHTLTENEIPAHTHGSKSLVGTMNPLAWATSASESGIVSGVQQHVDRIGNSGSNWGDRLYTINATHEHDSIGGDQAHNNMPPYLVVYMWRRLTLSPTIYAPPSNVLIGEVASEDVVPIAKGGTGATTTTAAKENLGIVSAVDAASSSGVVPFILSVSEGGTGANNAADARTNLGLTIYHKLIMGTTTAAGNLLTGLNRNDYIIIAASINRSQSGYYTSFYNIMPSSSDTDGNLTITAMSPGTSQTTVLSNQAIAVDIWYIANTSTTVT